MKLFEAARQAVVYAYSEPINMICSFNGLSELVRRKLRKKPESGDLFVFVNKRGNYVKILYARTDGNGFAIHAEKIDSGSFDVDRLSGELTVAQMTAIVNNIAMPAMRTIESSTRAQVSA